MAIETNGMIWTDAFWDLDYINISPKTAYTTPADLIPKERMIAPKLLEEVAKGNVHINEVRYIIASRLDDIFELELKPDFITISPMMHDAEVDPNFESGKGHKSMYGIVNQEALNRAFELVLKYRHRNARLSVQVHKFVGVR
jgi:organic radical activating enzyme